MPDDRELLVARAREAAQKAHAAYSGIRVGAAIRAASGAVYTGCNVENASYPVGNCAEASAVAAGVGAEGDALRIVETAVWATDRDGRVLAASPCGACRQRLHEFAAPEGLLVHFPWHGGELRTTPLGELLPYAFTLQAGSRMRS
ncbi:MAG TPA: cytidine deaminase [Steroidobacteraceae bacterium]|nr:cytidine deaminase [Steroidobacteraceae bacterium]